MIKLKLKEGKGIGARIKKSPFIEGLKSSLHEWLKMTAIMVKEEKLSGAHPFGGEGRPATGRFKKSIKARRPSGTRILRGRIGSEGLDYPPLYEWGRSARWHHPVVGPIFRREQARLVSRLQKKISEVLTK